MTIKSKKELTISDIKGYKPKEKPYYIWDKAGLTKGMGSFGIQISPNKTKRFVFKYRIEGKIKFCTLGVFPHLSLVDAREMARQYGALVLEGIDVNVHFQKQAAQKKADEKKQEEIGTIKQLFHAYAEYLKRNNKRTYAQILFALEKEVYPNISPATKAKDVTTYQLKVVLAQMIQRGAATQSNRVRSMLHAAFNYGIKHDNDPANMVIGTVFDIPFNPVTNIPKQTYAERVGQHFLTLEELVSFINDLANEYERFSMSHSLRHILLLCIFTGGQRPYELAASKWSAVNLKKKELLITGQVSKNKKSHMVPLVDTAIHILERQKVIAGGSEYIFPNANKLDDHLWTDSIGNAVRRYCKAIDETAPFVPRDIRRTCKTLMGKMRIGNKEYRDRLQNHAFNDVSSKHYDLYDYLQEKKEVLETWEEKLSEYQEMTKGIKHFFG